MHAITAVITSAGTRALEHLEAKRAEGFRVESLMQEGKHGSQIHIPARHTRNAGP